MNSTPDLPWFELIIPDPNNLSGPSIKVLLDLIVSHFNIQSVVISDAIGDISQIKELLGIPLRPVVISDALGKTHQLDWAFLFLYSEDIVSSNLTFPDDESRLKDSTVTIRLVDDSYFCIYTAIKSVEDTLRIRYPEMRSKQIQLSALEIPY